MESVLSPQSEQKLLERLVKLAKEYSQKQSLREKAFEEKLRDHEQTQKHQWEALRKQLGSDLTAAEANFQNELEKVQKWFGTEHGRNEFEYLLGQERILKQSAEETKSSANKRDRERTQAEEDFRKSHTQAERQQRKDKKWVESFQSDMETVAENARDWLRLCRMESLAEEPADSTKPEPEGVVDANGMTQLLEKTTEEFTSLTSLSLPKIFQGNRFVGGLIGVWISGVVPVILLLMVLTNLSVPAAAFAGAAGYGVLCAITGIVLSKSLYQRALVQSREISDRIWHNQKMASVAAKRFSEDSDNRCQNRQRVAQRTRTERLEAISHEYAQSQASWAQERNRQQSLLDDTHPRRQAELCQTRNLRLRQVVVQCQPRIKLLRDALDKQVGKVREQFEEQSRQLMAEHRQELLRDREDWLRTLHEIRQGFDGLNASSATRFPDWQSLAWKEWMGFEETPPSIRLGRVHVDLDELLGDYKTTLPRENGEWSNLTLPALVDFPDTGSVLIKGTGTAKTSANDLLVTTMFRYLTAFPPGKVRFTILDPVGLGKDFAPFMHLADYSEQLVTSRIWTESQQIAQRLADLTEHMENVLQTYLRSEFANIEEYNRSAGEVAEPYRILVVANFPVNFSDSSAERLLSIISSGPRCGVYTLMTVDLDRQFPHDIPIADLEKHCQVVENSGSEFRLSGPFAHHGLELDTPPSPEFVGRVVHQVGRRALEVAKVEVPFSRVAAKQEQWWQSIADDGLDVPIGPAGARRLQYLQLGQGTSQHVLMAGKTGSGKSTLLHVLITNLALHYSPDQVELYLIDFKKGVEFKRYATHRLPHARVVAIESEREFGLSVMQRLDEEMQRRGNLFREVGVQDLKGFRRRRQETPMPRVLLLVDEFQELFIEEDRLAQESSLLLDRLVRQGRAFGIHVLLGSQTLAGEYTLPRSTIGQMAVRIALQCSESDAHLIMSDDNLAARLLSRPGEAIYNDANGFVEGNHPFQVAWLSDEDSDRYLDDVTELSVSRPGQNTRVPPIIFEGNRPANPNANPFLDRLLAEPDWPATARAFSVWLGEPVAIKEPSSLVFRHEGGKNLLLIGQNPEAGLAILVMAACSLALQHPPEDLRNGTVGARFYLFDGSAVDDPLHGNLGRIADCFPHPTVSGGFRELPGQIVEIAGELDRRMTQNDLSAPSIYLMLYDLQRFREIRKGEDEFGFSPSYDDPPAPRPEKLLTTILKDGPAFGVHTLVWCDGWNNLNRTFDRASMGEFEMRVLFQMSTNDSSLLIDSPVASKLGPYRAFSFTQAQDNLEKFRPYSLPDDSWLSRLQERLHQRV